MPKRQSITWTLSPLLVALWLTTLAPVVALAQSQEPKPVAPATPVAKPATPVGELPETGVLGAGWQGPNFGVSVAWDPAVWTVENELIDAGYDGLQIGASDATVFIEAYTGFAGDADACLADAEQEIRERENVTDVAVLTGRPLPEVAGERGPAQLLGIVAALPEGGNYRGVEYVECRSLSPDAVLELTWQTSAATFNDELPLVSTLLTTIETPVDEPEGIVPEMPPPPVTEPNTA